MKVKFLVTLPVLACMMTACSSDDSPSTEQSPSNAIAFTSYVDQSTKASISGIDKLHEEGFRVIAVDHANDWNTLADEDKTPDFMYHQAVTWHQEMTAYQYSPLKYWPVDGNKVSFFAYSPGQLNLTKTEIISVGLNPSSNTTVGSPYLDYSMSPYNHDQIDLVTARAFNCTAETSNTHGKGEVYFEFTHALSKIGFAAKLRDQLQPGTTLTVKGLHLMYKQPEADAGIIRRGKYYLDTKTWELDATTRFQNVDQEMAQNLLAEHTAIPSTTEATTLNSDETYLMLLPQKYEEGTIEVAISYTITYKDPADAEAEEVTTLERTSIMTLPAIQNEADVNIGWEQNKSYTYVIEIGPDAISFDSPEIGMWYNPVF